MPLTYALLGTVLLLAGRGQPERAVELYALVSRYPNVAHSRWVQDVVSKPVAAAAALPGGPPPEVVSAAQERGRGRDLWATAEEMLEDLEDRQS